MTNERDEIKKLSTIKQIFVLFVKKHKIKYYKFKIISTAAFECDINMTESSSLT